MRPAGSTESYWPSLDGLRAVAVLAVVTFHAAPSTLSGGFLGVDLFFALSGFLITGLLLKWPVQAGRRHFVRFYVRRWWRLSPALLLMLLAVIAVAWMWPQPTPQRLAWTIDAAWSAAYISNWARALDWAHVERLGHTWSLAVEEQFYLLWPCVLWALRKCTTRPVWLLSAVTALALTGALWRWHLLDSGATVDRLYNGTDTRVETLLWGAALAILWHHWPHRVRQMPRDLVGWTLLPMWLFALACLNWDARWVYQWGITLVAWVSVITIACALAAPQALWCRWLSMPLLVRIGLWSYALYLWHFPVLRAGLALQWTGIGLWLGVVAISVALAALTHHWVEQPFLRWRERRFPA